MSFAPELRPLNQMAHGEMAQYGDDSKLMARFEKRAVLNAFESDKAGKPIYEDRDYITITQPGAKSDLTREVITEWRSDVPPDTIRWGRQWDAYRKNEVQLSSGIPLENWPPMGVAPAAIKGFKAADIFTVEQLSGIPDSVLAGVPVLDGRKWRDLAIKYCEAAVGGAPIAALQSENEVLRQQITLMRKDIEALAANQKKTPGRKPAGDGDDE